MYNTAGQQAGTAAQFSPLGNAFDQAKSGFIKGGLGAYGEKILGSSSEYMQSNVPIPLKAYDLPLSCELYGNETFERTFNIYSFCYRLGELLRLHVGLNIYVTFFWVSIICAFYTRGHWTRMGEPVRGKLSYKHPIYDINAPDMYIPFMAFGTYVVLCGFFLGLRVKFSPESLNWLFVKGLAGWLLQVSLLKMILLSLGSGEMPLLDIVAYAGYTFTDLSMAVLRKILVRYTYYAVVLWTCLRTGIFLVRTMKRVLLFTYP